MVKEFLKTEFCPVDEPLIILQAICSGYKLLSEQLCIELKV